MDLLGRCIKGRFEPHELRRYLAFEVLFFWGLIFVCWNLYPKENHYSIMTHTFSFLGAFAPQHNPRWWWIFTIAMIFWGTATIPLALYHRRRFAAISRWGAAIGTGLFLIGSIGTILVGIFPDDRMMIIGNWRSTDIHARAALLIAAGFTFGILWYALLLLKNLVFKTNRFFNYRKLAWPYLFWITLTGVGVYFQVKWGFIYADMKAAAKISGQQIGSSWSEAMNTRYSFPLWENIVIYTLFIFLIWFTLVLPSETTDSNEN